MRITEYKLNDVCARLSSGKNIKSDKIGEFGLYPVFGGNGIRGYTNTSNFTGECALIGRQGAYCGNVRYFRGECYVTEHAIVACGNEKCNTRTLSYLLSTMQLGVLSHQAAQPGLSVKVLKEQLISLPSIEEQNKIAFVLSAYDDLIENNQKQIKLLEEAAQRLYKEWFVDLRFPGYEDTPIVDGVPEGWEKGTIISFFTTVLGGTPAREKKDYWGGSIPWINSGEVNKLRIIKESEFISDLGLKYSATKLMPVHTTVLAITGATLGQVSYTEIETCANQSVVGIYDQQKAYSEYIYLAVSNEIKGIISKATGGAQQHINKDIVNNFEIMLPSEVVNNQLKSIISPLFTKITNCYFTTEKLTETRDRLLPKLMSGEIEVYYEL